MIAKPTDRLKRTSYLGLFFILVLTTIFWFPPVYKAILPDNFELRNYLMQAMDWFFVGIICLLIIKGERNKLSTLQIKKLNDESFSLGMALGGISMIFIVAHKFLLSGIGEIPAFEQQISNPELNSVGPEFIFTYGIFSLLTAAFAEEIIYRGYATERIMLLEANKFWAFCLPWLAFILMHYRKGLDHLIPVAIVAALMQFVYLKYRNLSITIVAHFLIDALAYIGILYNHFSQN